MTTACEPAVDEGGGIRKPGLARQLGPVVLATAVGVDLLFAGIMLWEPPSRPGNLTAAGMDNLRPERDTVVYLGAGAVALLLAAALSTWSRAPAHQENDPSIPTWVRDVVPIVVGLVAMALATTLFVRARPELSARWTRVAYAAVSATIAAVCLVTARWSARRCPAPAPGGQVALEERGRRRLHLLDLLAPVLIVVFVYVPAWRHVAGNAFAYEDLLHLDYFVMGQAVAFHEGAALGSEIFSYYGVGWPLLLSGLSRIHPLGYGNFVHLEVVYGCIYFVGVYAFLRILVGNALVAVSGTALAVFLQLFADGFLLWRFPSATVMRWAFDVWFFLALLAYARTRRRAWVLVAAGIVGAAVLFQTDTGLFLGASFAFSWLCLWRLGPDRGDRLRLLAASTVVAGGVLFGGLFVASRGTVLSSRFWTGWLENLGAAASGATLLPLSETSGTGTIVLFVMMTTTYLVVAGWAVARLVRRQLDVPVLVLGPVAIYGFLTLIYFVGRSSQYNLFRPAVPFAIIVAACAGLGVRAARRWAPGEGSGWARVLSFAPRLAAPTMLVLSVVMVAADPYDRAYPSLARTVVSGRPDDGLCLFDRPRDVCGLPPEARPYVDDLHAAAETIRRLRAPEQTVAVLDASGPLLYLMADAPTWGRYSPVIPGLFTTDMVDAVLADLAEDPPDLVIMRSREQSPRYYDDIWTALREPVERGYLLHSTTGRFETWKRK